MISAADMMSGRGKLVNPQKQKLTEKDLDDARKEEELSNFVVERGKFTLVTDEDGNTALMEREKTGKSPSVIKIKTLNGTNREVSEQIQKETKKNKEENKQRGTQLKGEKLKRTYRDRGGVLRYPFEALTERTDYLQIDINQYESARERSGNENNLIGRVGTRRLSTRGRNPFGLTTKSLVNKGTILLQIPSQVQDGNSVSYGDSKMNTVVGAGLQAASNVSTGAADALMNTEGGIGARLGAASQKTADAVMNAFQASNINLSNARQLFNAQIATGVVGALGGNVTVNQLLARQSGQIFNPNMELLFNGPTLRNFRFSFKMTPRSPEEAEQCKLIIRTFKMNMAPKVTSGRGEQSLFLNTPNVFELRYKSGAANHPFLHRFKQCFLTDISVNYTGEGVYATYENREPVSMIMDLTFKELEPIYDQDYFDDIGRDADSTVGF